MGSNLKKNTSGARLLLLISLALLFAMPGLSQGDRGTITGLVTDSTQAAVPDVEVTITHVETNIQTSTRSGATGVYNLLRLPPGNYTLVARKEGFRSYQQTEVPVQVGETLRLDIALDVGALTEQVTVVGAAPLISSESAEVGLVLTSSQFTELPLTLGGSIRNPSSFIFLQPGVTPGNTWEKHVNGNPAFTDQVYYDGISLSRGDLANDGEVNPSVDAIAEFKLISNNYSAEYAHGMGGITTFTYKSGTNDLHGNAFFLNSVEAYNARNFFQPSKPQYRQNNWGFTVGGPILIPKVYNGTNKSFFFFSFDQYYLRSPGSPGLATVPSSKMLQGDFTEWVNAGRGTVYDPATTRQNAGAVVQRPIPGQPHSASALEHPFRQDGRNAPAAHLLRPGEQLPACYGRSEHGSTLERVQDRPHVYRRAPHKWNVQLYGPAGREVPCGKQYWRRQSCRRPGVPQYSARDHSHCAPELQLDRQSFRAEPLFSRTVALPQSELLCPLWPGLAGETRVEGSRRRSLPVG